MATVYHRFAHTVKLTLVRGYATTLAVASEPIPQQVTMISVDDSQLEGAKEGMVEDGWKWLGEVPAGWTGEEVSSRLSADGSAITGTSFVEVASASLIVLGGKTLEVDVIGAAAVLLATGAARLKIDGDVVATQGLETLDTAAVRLGWCKPSIAGTHTASLEMAAGTTGSVTPKTGTTIRLRER